MLTYLLYIIGRVAIVPVLASLALAYILNPVVEIFEKRGFSRVIAASLALFLVTACVVLFIWFVIPDLWNQSVSAGDVVLKAFTEKNAQQARSKIHEFSPARRPYIGYRVYKFVRESEQRS